MAQQTFIIKVFTDAETYSDALKTGKDYDFYRVGCKRIETCRKYIKNWRKQAIDRGFQRLYKSLTADNGRYEIEATPNGYSGDVVERGFIADIA